MTKGNKLKIFVSYSHKDAKYKKELLTHLTSLELTHNIDVWHDGKIEAGEEIDKQVLIQLGSSDIVLLLVSPYFLASYYCIEVELQKAIKKHEEGTCIVIPVILSESVIDQSMPFFGLMRVPEDGKPIQKFKPQNNGYVNSVAKIKQLIDSKFIDTRKPSVKEPSAPISIMLFQDGKELPYVIDDVTWKAIETIRYRIIDFQKIANEKLIDSIFQYKQEFARVKKSLSLNQDLNKYRKGKLKCFLLDISATIRAWIFKDVGVRVHFRVLNKDEYLGFMVVDGKAKTGINVNFAKKITAIKKTSGMIYYSGELNTPLIKSKNESLHEKAKHDEEYPDYITSAFKLKEICSSACPLMSMGISIEKEHCRRYSPYLVALSFLRFDVIVENLIMSLCINITKIDKGFNIEEVIQ